MASTKLKKWAFIAALIACATPWISTPLALAGGFLFAHFWGHPFERYNNTATKWLLKIAVVGLGFGINISQAVQAGQQGIKLTALSITIIFVIGYIIKKIFPINSVITHLISSGTAICGGSAIAAVSPIINATEKEISIALGAVFLLNSIALFIFPPIGHLLGLSQYQFGLWAAIAIHDTGSVVGAAAIYGSEALKVATIVKLARALWIVPVALVTMFFFKGSNNKITAPWFIGFFILAMLINSYIPAFSSFSGPIVAIARSVLVITLFLIGAGLSVEKLKEAGVYPLALAVILWITIAIGSLLIIA